jgi:hypothetical protein
MFSHREQENLSDRLAESEVAMYQKIHLSKQSLGEGYIVATGVVLAAVLAGQLLVNGLLGLFWVLASCLSILVLIGAIYWLHRLDLDGEQIWLVANWSALSLGVGTIALFGVEIATTATLGEDMGTAVLGTALAGATVTGTLVGVVGSLDESNRKLRGQNAVLHRVLRHNLRNDMSVVLCMLDDIERSADGETAAKAQEAREKIRSVVRLTDSVREANVSLADPSADQQVRNLSEIVQTRVESFETTDEELSVETDLPKEALVRVSDEFGLVVDNILECALGGDSPPPQLLIRIEQERETVRLICEDTRQTISRVDISAVSAGSETALEHALGVELWLVEWLVDASDGSMTFETGDECHRISIELDRAREKWLH